MATNRTPGGRTETFKHNSTISYDATKRGGSEHALSNFAVKAVSAGVGLVQDAEVILGELMEVYADGNCTVKLTGTLEFKMGAANGATPGSQLVGALGDSVNSQTGGYVKSGGNDVDARGVVKKVSGSTKNSIVTTTFP